MSSIVAKNYVTCNVSPPQPWCSRIDVTKGDDWMDQTVSGCKDILPGDEMTGVSSLFTLIASQGTMPSPTAVSWRPDQKMCLAAHPKEHVENYSSLHFPFGRNLSILI